MSKHSHFISSQYTARYYWRKVSSWWRERGSAATTGEREREWKQKSNSYSIYDTYFFNIWFSVSSLFEVNVLYNLEFSVMAFPCLEFGRVWIQSFGHGNRESTDKNTILGTFIGRNRMEFVAHRSEQWGKCGGKMWRPLEKEWRQILPKQWKRPEQWRDSTAWNQPPMKTKI